MHKLSKMLCLTLAVLIMIFSLSGCVQMIVGLDIKTDGSADISVKAGISNQVYSMLSGNADESDPLDETKQEAQNNGYKVEDYTEGDYKGIIMTKHIDNLETAAVADTYTEGLTFKKEKRGLKQLISLSGSLASAGSLKQNMTESSIDVSAFDMKLVVSVPYPITKTNATQLSDDKKTATFDLTTLDAIELECLGDVMLFGAIPMRAAAIVVGILAVCAIVLIIIGAVKKRKLHAENEISKNKTLPTEGDGSDNPPDGE